MAAQKFSFLPNTFLPNLLSVLNMSAGFVAILSAMNGALLAAAWLIILAAVFDWLDGAAARLTRSASRFGVELDSLSDLVSFGVAPSILLYTFYFRGLGPVGIFLAALPLLFGALRLARFNIEAGFKKEFFKGLPIPSAAMTLASYVIFFSDAGVPLVPLMWRQALVPLVIALAGLMISTFRYETFPAFSKASFEAAPLRFVFFYGGLVASAITLGKAIFPWALLYVLSGVFGRANRAALARLGSWAIR